MQVQLVADRHHSLIKPAEPCCAWFALLTYRLPSPVERNTACSHSACMLSLTLCVWTRYTTAHSSSPARAAHRCCEIVPSLRKRVSPPRQGQRVRAAERKHGADCGVRTLLFQQQRHLPDVGHVMHVEHVAGRHLTEQRLHHNTPSLAACQKHAAQYRPLQS